MSSSLNNFGRECFDFGRAATKVVGAWLLLRFNPFWAQTLRVESRRGFGFRLVAWFFVLWVFWFAIALVWDGAFGYSSDLLVLGAKTWLGVSWLLAMGVAHLHLSAGLRSLWLKERLIPVLLSPLAPEEVASLSGAPGVLLGLATGVLSLPAWALGLGMGFLNGRDALGFVLLLLVSCVGFPSWSSATWEARLDAASAASTRATAASGRTKAAPNPPPPSLTSPGFSPGSALVAALVLVVGALFCSIPLSLGSSFEAWVKLWPREITSESGRLVTAPLLVSRLLVYPLPFYALSLPVCLVLAPFWAGVLAFWHLGLSAGLEARANSRTRRRARGDAIWRPLRFVWAPIAAGFGLPVAYESDWLAAWRGASVVFPSKWGLDAQNTLAWWHGLAALGTFAGCLWLRQIAGESAKRGESWTVVRARLRFAIPRVALGILAAGVLCPLACGQNPFPVPLGILGVQLAVVAATWLGIQGALARENCATTRAFLPLPARIAPGWIVLSWVYGAPIVLALGSFALSWGKSFINPLSWPFCLLSPSTLWFAPRDDASISPSFFGAATVHLAVALLLCARAARLPLVAPEAAPPLAELNGTEGAPARARPEQAALRTATRLPLNAPTPSQKHFLRRFDGLDNPLLILELRRAMGKGEWLGSMKTGALAGAILVVVGTVLVGVVSFVALGLMRAPLPGVQEFIGLQWMFGLLCALGLGLMSVIALSGADGLYGRDRLDGSLESLFLTPLATREIIAGKIVPVGVRSLCWIAAFWPPLATVAFLLSLVGDFRGWPFVVLLPLVVGALALRCLAWLHLGGVASPVSRIVFWATWVGFIAVPAAFGWLCFAAPFALFESLDIWPKVLALGISIPLCLLDCALPLWWSERVLERERRAG